MLSWAIFLPLLTVLVLWATPRERLELVRGVALAGCGLTLLLLLALWAGFEPERGYQFVQRQDWIPALGVGYAVGADGVSLPLLLLTGVLFLTALVFSWPESHRAREYYGWFLFLETACLGVFAALDLFLFYVFWDLTLVGMYFIIALWGHEGAREAALRFFLYTFVGSLALLLGIIGLYLASDPLTMDMATLSRQDEPGPGWVTELVFLALLLGFGIKIPVVPVHTWLPPAHAEAPAAGSAILAGVLLKMGTYGLLRILLPMMPQTFQTHAPFVVAVGVISVLYGVLAALAQTDLKRLIAYTSVNHMGYVVLAVGAAAVAGENAVKRLALNGATLQMVSHGLITGSLFLLSGVLWRRTRSFDIAVLGGLRTVIPAFSAATALAAFASLGLPGLSGFVAEFQIFVGAFGSYPQAAAIALLGILLTAGLFLWTLQRVLLGEPAPRWAGLSDMHWYERAAVYPLLALVVLIGVLPMWILGVIDSGVDGLLALLAG